MFIFWGTKIVVRPLGYVADFCPLCRGLQPFRLSQVKAVGHVYYLSLGRGRLVGHQRACLGCGTALNAQPAVYASIADESLPPATLAARTYPKFAEAYRARLALEERVAGSLATLSAEERRALIRDPLLLISPKVERRFASTHIDKESGLTMLGVLAALGLGFEATQRIAPDSVPPVMLAILLVGAVLIGWQVTRSNVRFMHREIVPVLAKALRPLQPREPELRSALDELKRVGHKIGSKLPLRELVAALG